MKQKFYLLIIVLCIVTSISAQITDSKRMILAWDCSFSMENREVESDFKFLDNYFGRNPDLTVSLVLFANKLFENREFKIVGGDWRAIRKKLENVAYDGATNYKAVENQISLVHDELLLFTDGAQTLGTGIPDFGIKTFIINSNPYKEQNDLNALLVVNKGRLFDYGRPIFSEKAAQFADSKDHGVAPKAVAQSQDSVPIGTGVQLDEVVVSENRRVENPVESVNIGNGEVDKNRLGVAVQSIGDEQISPITTDVSNAVQGKFSGVQIGTRASNWGAEADISKVTMRTNNSMILNNYGLIVIDGVPQQQADSSKKALLNSTPQPGFGFIDPENIADITVLKGMAATTRYGTLGANGVILITTKTAKGGKAPNRPVDRARLTNNIYEGDLPPKENQPIPSYIKELQSSANISLAYTKYLGQRMDYLSSPGYFIDAYDYFKGIDVDKANRILSNIVELNANNVPLLRILAYKYEVEGEFADAFKINEKILELDERSVQAKFDMAISAEDTKKYGLAYAQLTELVQNNDALGIDYSAMKKPVTNELRKLLNTKGANISITDRDKPYANPVHFDARILIMWSKGNAEFELQIINPDKRFFTWEHSELGDPQRYLTDVKNDTNTEEFQLIGAEKGDWYIKVNDLRQYAHLDPVYLKCIVFYDFGLPAQRKVVQMVPLTPDVENGSFFKIQL